MTNKRQIVIDTDSSYATEEPQEQNYGVQQATEGGDTSEEPVPQATGSASAPSENPYREMTIAQKLNRADELLKQYEGTDKYDAFKKRVDAMKHKYGGIAKVAPDAKWNYDEASQAGGQKGLPDLQPNVQIAGSSVNPDYDSTIVKRQNYLDWYSKRGWGSRFVSKLSGQDKQLADTAERAKDDIAYLKGMKNALGYAVANPERARALGALVTPRQFLKDGSPSSNPTSFVWNENVGQFTVVPSEIRIKPREPMQEAQQDAKGGDTRTGTHAASEAGDAPRRTDLSNFLATDEVPETLFGIPIVASPEQYTEADIAFFKEHPRAGGFYELGDEDTDDQATAGGGDTSEEPNTLVKETLRAASADLFRYTPRERTAADLSANQKEALANAWAKSGDGIYSYGAYGAPIGGGKFNAFNPSYWTNKDPTHQVEKLFGRATAHWTKDGDLELRDVYDIDTGDTNLIGVPTNKDPKEYKIHSRISAKAVGLDPENLWKISNAQIRQEWNKIQPALSRAAKEISNGTYTGGADPALKMAKVLQARFNRINSGPYKLKESSPIAEWKDPYLRAANEFNDFMSRQPAATIKTRRETQQASGAEGTSEELPRYYKVRPGDNLTKIAKATGVSNVDIAKYSKLADPNKIRPGQMLLLTEPYPGKWNNPGNVQWSNEVAYEGETGRVKSNISNGYFLTFDTPQNGLNAKAQVIGQNVRVKIPKQYREGKIPSDKFTVENLITVYAPPKDKNDTPGYIKFVADKLGVRKDAVLNIDDAKQMASLLKAIATRDSKPEYAEWFRDSEYAEAVKKIKIPAKDREKSGKKGK